MNPFKQTLILFAFLLLAVRVCADDTALLASLEKAWSTENASAVAAKFPSKGKIYIKLNGTGGYYSSDQALSVISQYFKNHQVTGLKFASADTGAAVYTAAESVDKGVRKLEFTVVSAGGTRRISAIKAQ